MSKSKKTTIGLFGFGVVGEGLYQAIRKDSESNLSIKKIAIKHASKERNAPSHLFTTDMDEILNDDTVQIIVEAISDADAAFEIARRGIRQGKKVVSASKKMLAENLPELLRLQKEFATPFLYESAACAAIPILRNLEEYYFHDDLQSWCGILNGSTNFILSMMFKKGLTFDQALVLAREKGFAELDASLDVDGWDAAYKLTLITYHAFGLTLHPHELLFHGIRNINQDDARNAEAKGCVIKLLAQSQRLTDGSIASFVLPALIPSGHPLAFVENEYNGVVIKNALAEEQFFYGKGAGSVPTATAILSDVSAQVEGYHYAYRKSRHAGAKAATSFYLNCLVRYPLSQTIPLHDFKQVTDTYERDGQQYLTGLIAHQNLLQNDWWRKQGCSLLLLPDPIVSPEDLSSRQKR